MRIRITGDAELVKATSLYLIDGGFLIGDEAASYSIEFKKTSASIPSLDGVDCKLEGHLLNSIAMVANTAVLVDRPGPNRSDSHIVIGIPESFDVRQLDAIARGVKSGFENMFRSAEPEPPVVQMFTPASNDDLLRSVIVELREIARIMNTPKEKKPWWQNFFGS